MILFCDTSALVKLYVREAGSDRVLASAAACEALAASRIAWAEAMAAFARRVRDHPSDADALAIARARFEAEWDSYIKIEVTQPLVQLAGDYADTFALRAYDSVQLASAQTLSRELPGGVAFACFDARLSKAAQVLGMGGVDAAG